MIDGVLDDPVWKKSRVTEVKYPHFISGGNFKTLQPAPMRVRFAWDERYLYIGYEVDDKNLQTYRVKEKQGPSNNRRYGLRSKIERKTDLVEFLISFESRHFFWEIHHNAANDLNDYLVIQQLPDWQKQRPASTFGPGIYSAEHEYLKDDRQFTLKMASHLLPTSRGKSSSLNDKVPDTGYHGELRIPWQGLGAPRSARRVRHIEKGHLREIDYYWDMKGVKINILSVVENGDLPVRYHHSSPKALTPWFHASVLNYPLYECVE